MGEDPVSGPALGCINVCKSTNQGFAPDTCYRTGFSTTWPATGRYVCRRGCCPRDRRVLLASTIAMARHNNCCQRGPSKRSTRAFRRGSPNVHRASRHLPLGLVSAQYPALRSGGRGAGNAANLVCGPSRSPGAWRIRDADHCDWAPPKTPKLSDRSGDGGNELAPGGGRTDYPRVTALRAGRAPGRGNGFGTSGSHGERDYAGGGTRSHSSIRYRNRSGTVFERQTPRWAGAGVGHARPLASECAHTRSIVRKMNERPAGMQAAHQYCPNSASPIVKLTRRLWCVLPL